MILMMSVSDVAASELPARQVDAGDAVAVLAVTAGAVGLKEPRAVLDVGRRVAVLLRAPRRASRRGREDEYADSSQPHGPP